MGSFFSFDRMITPTIIKILFWVGIGFAVLSGIIQIVTGASSPYGGGGMVLTGLLTMLFGPLLVRVYCEILIIFFKMDDSLKKIEKHLGAEKAE